MVKQHTKLVLRAFNGECEGAVANVAWNNITKMEERVRKSREAINNLGTVLNVVISSDFLELKLQELRLTHECEEKKHEEREEQKRLREEMREEEKARQEFEEAREEAELEEARYQKALQKATADAAAATGGKLDKLSEQIRSLEAKIEDARGRKERAISRAELTRSGFVYVISNVGSFGENVFKIGMTRRMEPMDRIDELSGASVPFPFDLHVMLYSDNAPDLEHALHDLFEKRRVNLVNARKEFFSHVALAEIEAFVKRRGLSAQFIEIPEAKQYRETLAMKHVSSPDAASVGPDEKFPQNLFVDSGVHLGVGT
jgi:hypothetical protein